MPATTLKPPQRPRTQPTKLRKSTVPMRKNDTRKNKHTHTHTHTTHASKQATKRARSRARAGARTHTHTRTRTRTRTRRARTRTRTPTHTHTHAHTHTHTHWECHVGSQTPNVQTRKHEMKCCKLALNRAKSVALRAIVRGEPSSCPRRDPGAALEKYVGSSLAAAHILFRLPPAGMHELHGFDKSGYIHERS